ncbi:MAG: branched-chain amino acid transporter permease [Acutalibacteraceae bacterium]|nr:branched-chain amino acid transporter permease [Acutalibacteraceae bacterium]
MTYKHQILTVLIIFITNLFLRFAPFIAFPDNKPTPKFIKYIGKVLPASVFSLLIVYCLKNVNIFEGSHGIPELICIAVTAALQLWKKQMLISISVGTILYMLLVQFVF